jgi:hypothetical protein
MYVKIHGPNLNDQSKGTFHVHERDCLDNKKYGPGRVLGGEDNGWIMNVDSVRDIVVEVYSDHINEQPESEQEDYIQDLFNDFYFAPCCSDLPPNPAKRPREPKTARVTHMNAETAKRQTDADVTVFECWVGGVEGSFEKHNNVNDVTKWVKRALIEYGPGRHVHIGIHSSSDYTNTEVPGQRLTLDD